jgi:type II secretory pathway component GspD/PulD (secretin)
MRHSWMSWLGTVWLAVLIFLCPAGHTFSDDIEIDLNGSTPTAMKATPVPSPVKTSAEIAKPPANHNIHGKALARVSGEPVVTEVKVTGDESGQRIEISGVGLPKPNVDKVSSKKILIKFKGTKLEIPRRMMVNKGDVKSVRSSPHPGSAWIVLDVTRIKNFSAEESRSGFSILLNESGLPNSKMESKVQAPPNPASDESGESKMVFSRLIDVSTKETDKGEKLVLTLDSPAKYTLRKLLEPDRIILHFLDTKLEIKEGSKKFRSDDPELKRGGLLGMQFRQLGPAYLPTSEAILTVVPGVTEEIDKDLNQVVLTFSAPPEAEKAVEKTGNINQLISMDVQSADLNSVIKTIADEAGFEVNFVPGPLTGVVDQKFKDVPFKTVLADLLAPYNYGYDIQGSTLRVGDQTLLKSTKLEMPRVTELITPSGGMTPDTFDKLVRAILPASNASTSTPDLTRNLIVLNGTPSDVEEYRKAVKELKLDSDSNGARITRVVKLNYADANSLAAILRTYLTPIGNIQVDEPDQKLILWETTTNMGVLLDLINEMDKKPAQVLIESNIVEVDDEADLDLGIVWNANTNAGADPSFVGSISNPPSSTNGNPGSFTFGTVKSGVNISAQIQALETHKKGKVVSRPRIATASGVPAEIDEVENVIVSSLNQVISNGQVINTITYQTLALPIDLKVTPRITDDGRITTVVNASITSQSGPAAGADQPPPTNVQTATTTITIKNGETIVIGGLYRQVAQEVTNGIPILSSIPIIGGLFQSKDRTNRKEELVIFITPTILED